MSVKIKLPPPYVVAKWNEQKVIKWLKKVNLEDCTPAFEARHIDGEKLLELTEQKLFTYQDVKIKHRGQIAKCVNECKSQASNAKKLVGTIRHRPPNKPRVDPNADYEYNSDDFDDWDSDFDEDFDDESIEEAVITIAPSTNVPTNSVIEPEMIKTENVSEENFNSASNVPMFQATPSSAAVTSKPIKIENRSSYPRPPLKRPPSQPPPPPVPQLPTQEILEEYEIPITHQNNSTLLARKISLQESMLHSNFLRRENSLKAASLQQETYEPVQPADENYEIVETPPISEKPILFPRNNGVPLSPSPPPLPHKPLKFQMSSLSNHDTMPAVSRPKLPTVDDNSNESSGSLATFMSSILGRRSSTPSSSPKTSHRSFRDLSGNLSSADSQSSRSSSPEKDGLFMVGSSAFFSSPSSWSSDSKPQIPLKSKSTTTDDIAQTMASRPLPPVPTIDVKIPSSNQQKDLHSYPWFHEVERNDAENEVKDLGISGAFLVRPSKRAGKENPYTVTILYEGKIFHLNIRQRPDDTYALGKEKKKEKTFPSVADLIAHHQKEKILLTTRGESAGQTTLNAFPEK